MALRVGMDIGSTTIKMVVMDERNHILYKNYKRHMAKILEMVQSELKDLQNILHKKELLFAISGSAGMKLAEDGKFLFVQEVFATAHAVKIYNPITDVVVELGGEDAKIIYLNGSLEERMNSTCAGGTGAFIDQMANLLNVSLEDMDRLSLNYDKLYPIASRCGVFAKSDIQPLINQGVSKENLAASIFQSVVDQTITGLAQGRGIEGNILFLGGPLYFLKGLRQRFQQSLKLEDDHAVFSEMGPYYVALGTALYAGDNAVVMGYREIVQTIEKASHIMHDYVGLDPLFKNDQEYLEFITRHRRSRVERNDIQTYQGNAYLGIDAGSTTTKLILLDDEKRILYESYQNNLGNPVDIVRGELLRLYAKLNGQIKIQSSAITGYGEELLKNVFHIDIGVVETIAHYTAAKYFNENVDFIIDIGGQDMKCFRIKDKSIDDIILNEACSSGCGSFIETFAKSMGYDVEQFASLGLASHHPVDLGSRCTVFMNSSVKQAQKNGASIEDISAGLCISVVKNALYKVIRAKKAEDLGNDIIVQGGTFLNDTILRSFEKELGRSVIRPDIAGLMGAYGAALIAKSKDLNSSQLIRKVELEKFHHVAQATRCGLCTNHCLLTINTFGDHQKYIAGNKCERPLNKANKGLFLPNLYQYKYESLRNVQKPHPNLGRIGIPMVLNMFDLLPFYKALWTHLGYEVVLSDPSSQKLYKSAQQTIPSDTVCFPAKLVHGHIQNLIDKKVDMIFYPSMSYNLDEGMSDNSFNCPIVAYYPQLIETNMELDEIPIITTFLTLSNKNKLFHTLCEILDQYQISYTSKYLQSAIQEGYKALNNWRSDIQQEGKRAIEYAREHELNMIVLCGRPYHVDPFIHHGIPQLLNDLHFVVLSEDCFPPEDKPTLHILNQWTYHARMFHAAKVAMNSSDMDIVQLVSFSCGIDAITTDEMKDILRENNKLYTQIKIDEIDNLGAVRIRLRSLQSALEERGKTWNT